MGKVVSGSRHMVDCLGEPYKSGLEHLPYNERVGGSSPSTPTGYCMACTRCNSFGEIINAMVFFYLAFGLAVTGGGMYLFELLCRGLDTFGFDSLPKGELTKKNWQEYVPMFLVGIAAVSCFVIGCMTYTTPSKLYYEHCFYCGNDEGGDDFVPHFNGREFQNTPTDSWGGWWVTSLF